MSVSVQCLTRYECYRLVNVFCTRCALHTPHSVSVSRYIELLMVMRLAETADTCRVLFGISERKTPYRTVTCARLEYVKTYPCYSPVVAICTASLTFSNSSFCPHNVFMCFVWIWEQTAIISLYTINWLGFINETECLLRGTDWIFIYNSTFCPHSVFTSFVWIWEQTAIISLYSINWLVFITETQCEECWLTGCDAV